MFEAMLFSGHAFIALTIITHAFIALTTIASLLCLLRAEAQGPRVQAKYAHVSYHKTAKRYPCELSSRSSCLWRLSPSPSASLSPSPSTSSKYAAAVECWGGLVVGGGSGPYTIPLARIGESRLVSALYTRDSAGLVVAVVAVVALLLM